MGDIIIIIDRDHALINSRSVEVFMCFQVHCSSCSCCSDPWREARTSQIRYQQRNILFEVKKKKKTGSLHIFQQICS